MAFGTLKPAMRPRQWPISSSGVTSASGGTLTTACTASPQRSSGTPNTAASRIASCSTSTDSTSIEYTFSPPVMIMSLSRSTMNR